jgi:hypothetical protein
MNGFASEPLATAADARALGARLTALLDRGDAAGAIAHADEARGDAVLVAQLRAYAYTEGGRQLRDRGLTERGRDLWQSLAGQAQDGGYNLANAEQALFELAVGDLGYLAAFEQEHEHLARARRGYEAVAVDGAVADDLKLQALTNLGNCYDLMGRDLDALTVWQRALAIDPNFAMAQGNIGVALAGVAPFMGEHAPTVANEAALALGAALATPEAIVAYGGPQAVEHFRKTREQLPTPKEQPAAVGFADPHFDWCREHELFLHVSHRCLRKDVDKLDPLFFRGLNAGIDDDEQQRVKHLVDAFNSIKQAYVSARYLTWLATAHDAPLRDHLDAVRGRVAFLDTLEYARFGVRTGIAVHAFAAATNVLDQVAGFVHLYLGSGRVRDVYFRTLARRRGRPTVDVELAARLEPNSLNRGLLALCDLAADLDEPTPLADLLERRHTATHRFLVVHEMLLAEERGDWLERVEWRTLSEQSIAQLQIARAALVYLARLIDINEAQIARGEKRPRVPLFLHRASEELAEIE